MLVLIFFFFQAEDGIRDDLVTGVQTCALPISPQDPEGNADPVHGIREIVAGTGGRSHDFLGFATTNSEVRDWQTYGILKLTLSPGKFTWEFIPEEVQSFRDSGDGVCHNHTTRAK